MMEKITINSIEKKMSKNGKPFWVVKATSQESRGDMDATIGAWDSQLADYLEKDVGVGGSVSVVITQKGDYTNITEVDMTSGVKGTITESEKIVQSSLMSQKDIGMCAGGMLKCMYYNRSPENEQEVYDMYHWFVKSLENDG